MFEAFVDLWNYTSRPMFDFLTPLEKFRRSRAEDPDRPVELVCQESLLFVCAHNRHLLE
ncbi:MAG: hypothetical protein ACKVX7_15090 [Planctomycetota bacterium]